MAHLSWLFIWAYVVYLHTLSRFFYAVSCVYAYINLHKPQPHMRIWKTTACPPLTIYISCFQLMPSIKEVSKQQIDSVHDEKQVNTWSLICLILMLYQFTLFQNEKQKCFFGIWTWVHNIALYLYLKPICICIGQKFEFRCYPLTADWGVPRATRVSFASLGLWRLHHHMPIVIILSIKEPSEMEVAQRYTLRNVCFVQYIFTRNRTSSDIS